MKSLGQLFLTCVALVVAASSSPAQAKVTILANGTFAYVSDGGPKGTNSVNASPFPTTFDATMDAFDGDAYSKNTIKFSESGGQTVFAYNMHHLRVGNILSNARTFSENLIFTSDVDAIYNISGYYHVLDVGAGGRVEFDSSLFDSTSQLLLFNNSQKSLDTQNEQFELGQSGGDVENILEGSLQGNLVAGHTYVFAFNAHIVRRFVNGAEARAVGDIKLKVVAIPEPSTLVLLLVASLLALVPGRR
jgi:hypothetical protein